MFTTKDIETRSVFVINCMERRALRVVSGNLLLENLQPKKTLTSLPFQKILAIFVIGNITVTTPLIDHCTRNGIPIVVMKPNLRPVFFFSITAEANFLLRKRQFELHEGDLTIPKVLVTNKLRNQLALLKRTRLKTDVVQKAKNQLSEALEFVWSANDLRTLMGIEGRAARTFFGAYYEKLGWQTRLPRTRTDPINTILDIGYTILFNFIEANIRLFGFDPYVGVYHRLWFKRKSLVCDLVEPFRCLIDRQVLKGFNLGQFKLEDFKLIRNEYFLKYEKNSDYTRRFVEPLIENKVHIFRYIRDFYRCFMKKGDFSQYPNFTV